MKATLDILAIGAHPDDVEIGCGGALILAADAGLRVAVADLTAGEMSTQGTPQVRERERAEASTLLGLCERMSLGIPDTRVGQEPWHSDALVTLLREYRPRIVLAPYPDDRHPDHAAAGRLVREACFFAGVSKFGAGEPHRPRRLYHYMLHHPFDPSFVLDVSAVWARRMAAVAAYESQFGSATEPRTEIGSPAFLAKLTDRASYFGAMIGASHGEPFHCRGPLAVTTLPGLDDSESRHGMPYRMFL